MSQVNSSFAKHEFKANSLLTRQNIWLPLPDCQNREINRHCSIAQFFNNVSHGYGEAELRFRLIHILETRKRRWHVSQIRLSETGVIKVVRRLESKVVRILLRMRGRDLRQIVMCEMSFRPNIAVKQLLIILALRIVPPSYTFIGYGSISHRLSGIFEEVNEILSPEAAEAAYRNDRWTNQIQRNSEVPIEIFFVVSEKIPTPILQQDHASVIGGEVTHAIPRKYERTCECIDAGALTTE
ncbi:hypothetical protein F2Q68_00011053 [Brassica cretica]|uniref:Uncharacterized protein n=1 Tax=Brassica cretica TaxID=69181 RepID=A0A8S9KWW7_BRACR|nr:hypothetical protein F2Q68_00011053 [Brassica cretica]